MNVIETKLKDVYIIEPQVFGDSRGWFFESWSLIKMQEKGLNYNFVQDNHSFSLNKGTLRGLHYQKGEFSQAKLVRCARGKVIDCVVDMRKGSPTYKQWLQVELSDKNFRQLMIPKGFLHSFLTLMDNVEFLYKADNYYNAESDRNVIWNDPELNIDWGIANPILSDKDRNAPLLKDSDIDFNYTEK